MHQSKQPDPLVVARQLYEARNYESSKKKLQQIKHTNECIELNVLLTEHKINPANSDIVLKALMDTLTKINIGLFNEMGTLVRNNPSHKNPIKIISHQFYYWNILAISQQIGKPTISSLITQQAIHFATSFRTQTALMIISQMLKQAINQSKLATCTNLITKFKDILDKNKKLSSESKLFVFMIRILWTKVMLRLGFFEQSVNTFMYKLGINQQQNFEQLWAATPQVVFPFSIYQQFLKAEVQYFKGNFKNSLQKLGQIFQWVDTSSKLNEQKKNQIKNLAQHNLAIVLMNLNKISIGNHMLLKTNQYFRKNCQQNITDNNSHFLYERNKQSLLYSHLKSPHSRTKQQYSKIHQSLLSQSYQYNRSYKFLYRKGQACMNYFHKILKQAQNMMPYKDIVDNYQCCYYYFNDPYYQSKGKNKNPLYNQGKRYYRRYHISQWDCKGIQEKKNQITVQKNEQPVTINVKLIENSQQAKQAINIQQNKPKQSQDKHIKKKRKSSYYKQDKKMNGKDQDNQDNQKKQSKPNDAPTNQSANRQNKQNIKQNSNIKTNQQLNQIVFQAVSFFNQALIILEQEKKIIVNLEQEETQKKLTQNINQKIDQDYRNFKQSILMNLCYLYLCRNNWAKVIEYSESYKKFVAYQKKSHKYSNQQNKKYQNQFNYYCVLNYQMEAYCQTNKFVKAYETMQEIAQEGYSETVTFEASSSINQNPHQCKIQQTNQYHNLLYNFTVLHARDNHLPESHQSLQKILSETNLLPNKYSMKTPLSVNDLLLHYYLRTSDRISGLQILKRRRVMGMGGVSGVYNTLKVTK